MSYLETIVQLACSLLSQKSLNVSSSLDWNGSLLKEIGSTKGNTVSEKFAPPKQPLTIWFITPRPTFRKKEFTASAFVDIKAAFDSAWHPAIIAALIKKNCPLYLVRIIGDYLANGKAQINIEGRETDFTTGCPQGDGILSAFLWITLIDDVFYILLPFPVFISAYADDLNIACSHSDPTTATSRLNIACSAVIDWLFSIKFLINSPKTIFMIFDFRRSNRLFSDNLSLTLQGTTMFPSTSTTFLGFLIDNLLSWKRHIELKCTSATRLFYSMRHCWSLTWGLNRVRLQILYKLIVEPTILYGCSIWAKRATLKSTKKSYVVLKEDMQFKCYAPFAHLKLNPC